MLHKREHPNWICDCKDVGGYIWPMSKIKCKRCGAKIKQAGRIKKTGVDKSVLTSK